MDPVRDNSVMNILQNERKGIIDWNHETKYYNGNISAK